MKANGTISIGVNRESPDSPMDVTHGWEGGPIAYLRRDVFQILGLPGMYDEIISGFRGRGNPPMVGKFFEWPVMVFGRTFIDDYTLICRTDTLRGKLSVPVWRSEMSYHELKRSLIRILEIWRLAHRPEGEVLGWVNIRPIGWVNNLIKRILIRLGLRRQKVSIRLKATDIMSGEMDRIRVGLAKVQKKQREAELIKRVEGQLADPVSGEMVYTEEGNIKNLTIDPPDLGEGFTASIVTDDGSGSPSVDQALETHKANLERRAKKSGK